MTSTSWVTRRCLHHGAYTLTIVNGEGWKAGCPKCKEEEMSDPLETSTLYGPVARPTLTQMEQIQSALSKQVAGSHYKDQAIQPVEYIHANKIGYFEGNVIKYVTRWRNKNCIADLEKAKHYIELLIELEAGNDGSKGQS